MSSVAIDESVISYSVVAVEVTICRFLMKNVTVTVHLCDAV
jgi:hypothetical protein